ncbi:MAG: SDR family NAD(P)-dependent oxidoreductase [Verrucomicrobiota bacterium]
MKRIFLTGASAGIGLATAKILLARGHEVWGTSRDVSRLPQLSGMHPVALDLNDMASVRESFGRALNDAGYFDVLINNAGSGHFGPAEFLSADAVRAQFQTVVFAHIELCRLALCAMRARHRGLIINVTSLASRLPVPFMAGYNAAKAAMASFTMTLQLELENSNIRIIDLQPGDIRTDFNDSITKTEIGDARSTARVEETWRVVDHNMKAAPPPELVAGRIAELIEQTNPPPRVTIGDSFQTIVAPLIDRVLPQRLRLWGLKRYYGLISRR